MYVLAAILGVILDFGRNLLSGSMIPDIFGINILQNPYIQSFMISAKCEHVNRISAQLKSGWFVLMYGK